MSTPSPAFCKTASAGAATSLVTMFAIAAAMFWLDPILALTALSVVPVVALAIWVYRRLGFQPMPRRALKSAR